MTRRMNHAAAAPGGMKAFKRLGTVLPLADAREAHFILEGWRPPPKGKIALTVETR
jgi:hypothetical protein